MKTKPPASESFDQIGAMLYRTKDKTWWVRGLDGWVYQDRIGSAWAMEVCGVAQGMTKTIDIVGDKSATSSEPSAHLPERSDSDREREALDRNYKMTIYVVVMAIVIYFIYR